MLLHSTNPINLLEKLVHDRLALLVADEASSVSDEGTDDTRGKTREEGLHTALLVDGLGAGHESLVLALRLHDGLHLQRGLRVRHRLLAHLHDIERVDAAPVRHTGDTSGHELGKSTLLLHVRQRLRVNAPARAHLVLLQESTTVDLVEAEVKRHADGITDQRRAEALPAAENAVGLDEANHYSSAYDMAFMARELIKHEKIFSFTTIYEDYLRQDTDNKFWLVNTNKLIKTYDGADGLKTGYTKEAGYCLTATAKRDRMRLIGAIMGASESKTRNSNMMKLLDYGFNSYEMQVEVKKGEVVSEKNMSKAENKRIEIVPKKDASVLVEKGNEKDALNYEMKLNKIKLPVKKGEKVGVLKLKDGSKVINEVDLTVKEDANKANILELYKRSIISILSGSL